MIPETHQLSLPSRFVLRYTFREALRLDGEAEAMGKYPIFLSLHSFQKLYAKVFSPELPECVSVVEIQTLLAMIDLTDSTVLTCVRVELDELALRLRDPGLRRASSVRKYERILDRKRRITEGS